MDDFDREFEDSELIPLPELEAASCDAMHPSGGVGQEPKLSAKMSREESEYRLWSELRHKLTGKQRVHIPEWTFEDHVSLRTAVIVARKMGKPLHSKSFAKFAAKLVSTKSKTSILLELRKPEFKMLVQRYHPELDRLFVKTRNERKEQSTPADARTEQSEPSNSGGCSDKPRNHAGGGKLATTSQTEKNEAADGEKGLLLPPAPDVASLAMKKREYLRRRRAHELDQILRKSREEQSHSRADPQPG